LHEPAPDLLPANASYAVAVPADEGSASSADAQWSAAFAGASVDSMRVYDTIVARLFTPWAHYLVDRLAPPAGCAALDVACGPGTVARILAERIGREGHLLATDISPAMLAVARSKPSAPDTAPIDWREAPAAPLPVPDSAVDIITCQQGLQFFPDKIGALAEMRRVLRRGGRAGVAVWTRVEDQLFGYLRDAIANVMSTEMAERYGGPFTLSGEDAADYARRAGFETVTLERVTLPAVLPGGATELFETWRASGIASDIAALDDAERAHLLAQTVRLTEKLGDGDALRGSLTASVLTLS
jgi:ubiquinone/menaquinone biosynthesis C-methylase UbiE